MRRTGLTILRREKSWGRKWHAGHVVEYSQYTREHHVIYEGDDLEAFEEWINLDEIQQAGRLRWQGDPQDLVKACRGDRRAVSR